uniref:TNFR-Cys domain-containing protein n=1 Tax=Graphocephala atropunctata TaxID=36148 RepID=A0A1B6MQB6_9HEMI
MFAAWTTLASLFVILGFVDHGDCLHWGNPAPQFHVTCKYPDKVVHTCDAYEPCVSCRSAWNQVYHRCSKCNGDDSNHWYDQTKLPRHLQRHTKLCLKSKHCSVCPVCKHTRDHYRHDPYLGCDGCEDGDDYVPA